MSEDKKTEEKVADAGPETTKDVAKDDASKNVSRVSGDRNAPLGGEEIDMKSDIQMPRLAILQGLSKMVTDGKAHAGNVANGLTKEIYGKEFTFIPLFLFKTRAMFNVERNLCCSSKNAVICSFNNDDKHNAGDDCFKCKDREWPDKGAPDADKGPACSLVYNYPVLNADKIKQFPISISLMRTALKMGRNLNSILSFTNEDWFSTKIKLTISQANSKKGVYFTPNFEVVGRTTDEEYAIAKDWFKTLKGRTIEVDLSQENPEDL